LANAMSLVIIGESDMHSSDISKTLRKNSTEEERILWSKLKDRKFHNLKFRRQYPFEKYILDFACLEKTFIIELDGSQHSLDKNSEGDAVRDKFLKSKNFKILRFWNNEIGKNLNGVLDTIATELGLN
jgi:very-short-patch-repair endonuclease